MAQHEPSPKTPRRTPPAWLRETRDVLHSLATGAEVRQDAVSIKRALSASGESQYELEPRLLLEEAATRLGMRIINRHATWDRLDKSLGEGLVWATPVKWEGETLWAVVHTARRRKIELEVEGGRTAWFSTRDVLAQLEPDEESEPRLWLSGRSALPCEGAADSHEGGADEHADADHEHGHLSPIRRLWLILKPEMGDIGAVTVFAAAVGLLALATPIAVEALVNTVAFGRLLQPLFVLCFMLLVFLGFAAVLRLIQAFIAEVMQRRIFVRVVQDLSYRLPRVQQTAIDGHHGPELMNRFFDVMTVQKSAALLVLDGIAIVLQAVIGMVVLAFYHPWLLGFDIFLLLSLGFTIFVLGRGGVRTAIEESRAKYAAAAWLEDLAHHSLAHRGGGGPERAVDYAERLTLRYLEARRAHFRVLLRQIGFSLGLQAVSGSLLLGIGGGLVLTGQLTLGELVAAELIVAVLVGSVAKLGKHLESFYDLLAAVDKLGHLFDLPVESQTGQTIPRKEGPARLRFSRAVISGYEDGQEVAEVTLDVAPGQMLAITGPPASGKSLLLDAAYGLRPTARGYIAYDGVDLRSLHPDSLRRQTLLLRDLEISEGTISQNVQFDRGDVSFDAVQWALREVDLLDEIMELPDGLETVLTRSGLPLSRSQCVRLMLARALAGRPRLLLIDGLLDSLPDAMQVRLMGALRRLCRHTTVIIVTGRDNLPQLCDDRLTVNGPSAPRLTSARLTAS